MKYSLVLYHWKAPQGRNFLLLTSLTRVLHTCGLKHISFWRHTAVWLFLLLKIMVINMSTVCDLEPLKLILNWLNQQVTGWPKTHTISHWIMELKTVKLRYLLMALLIQQGITTFVNRTKLATSSLGKLDRVVWIVCKINRVLMHELVKGSRICRSMT